MRRWLVAVLLCGSAVVHALPAAAQGDLEPPSPEDAAAIASIGALDDGYVCPAVEGAEADPYEEFRLSGGRNGTEVALDNLNMVCRYRIPGMGVADVKVQFSRIGVRPNICDVELLPYEATTRRSKLVDLGQIRPPLAMNAEFSVGVDAPEATVDGLRSAAGSMADVVAPATETCPTPLDIEIGSISEEAAAQLVILDEAASLACRQLDIAPGTVLERSGALKFATVVTDSITVGDKLPVRVPQMFPRFECTYEGASYEVTVDHVPALTEDGFANGTAFPDRKNGCDGVDQFSAPAALTLVVEADEILRPYVEAQATQVANALLPLAVDCQVELAEYEARVVDEGPVRPHESIDVVCPSIDGFVASFFNVSTGEPGPPAATMTSGIPRIFPGIDGFCSWDPVNDSGTPDSAGRSIQLTLYLLQDWRPAEEATRLCSEHDRKVSATTFGRLVSGKSATMVEFEVLVPNAGDIERAENAAADWLSVGESMARTCADVEIIDPDSLFEPLPEYLKAPVEAGLSGSFSIAPSSGSSAPDDTSDPDVDGVGDEARGESGGFMANLLRVVRVVMLVVSLAGLALALLLARRPSRIRPAMEYLRIGSALGGALVMMSVFSAGAPPWAVAVALIGGAGLGLLQGRNLVIVSSARGLMAKRSALAIAAFAVGLIATQVAGLLNRTGVISIGLALSFLSAAMAVGLVVGRRPALITARSAAGVAAILVIAGAVFGPAAIGKSAAQEPTATPVDLLNSSVAWDEISITGGFLGGIKPDLVITLDPSFAVAPDPITRDISIDAYIGGSFQQITATETYSFELVDGICCDLLYSATGSTSRTFLDGWVDPPVPILVEEGSLGVVGPVRNFSGLAFGKTARLPDGGCSREIVSRRNNVDVGLGAVAMVGGEQAVQLMAPLRMGAPCDLGVTLADAVGLTDPAPPPNSKLREGGGRQCPVKQEVIDTLAQATTFDPNTTSSITQRFVEPNSPACWDSGIEFGEEGRGGKRSELTYYLSQPEPRAALAFDRDSWSYIHGGLRNSDLDLVCERGPDGFPMPSSEGECARVGRYQVVTPSGVGKIKIFTDYATDDGPNVIVRGAFPSGIFMYRCHHCEPGDPEVASMIQSIVALVGQGSSGGDMGVVVGSRRGTVAAALAGSTSNGGNGRTANEDAAMAGLVGLIAAMGITAATLAESGLTAADLLSGWRSGGTEGVQGVLAGAGLTGQTIPAGPEPIPVFDEFGRPILPNGDDLFAWDTPDGTELLGREEIEERIAAAREANAGRDARIESIIDEQTSDEAAEQRFEDLGARSIAGNDADMEEIRAGWDRVDELGAQLERRNRLDAALTATQADQNLAALQDTWGQIFSETAQASWNDATEIPGIIGEAGLDALRAATNAENWRVLGETVAETVYDTAGLAAGNTFGDAQESIQQGVVKTGEVAAALGTQFVRHPIDTAAMFIPGRDFADALDGDRTLGQRLGSVGMGVLDVGATLAGAGVLGHADELVDTARAMDAAEEAVGAARAVGAAEETASAVRVLETAGDVPGQMSEAVRLADAAEEARQAARAAVASGNSADAARAMDAAAEAERVAEAARRSLFRQGGMQSMGRAEAAGQLSDELAQGVVNMHDEITSAATRQGVVDAVDDFARETGFRPREVMMGNSGSVGAGRSVLTDADRTIVASFTRDQLESVRRAGESFTDTHSRLQGRLTELHQRAAELAMNSPSDPAVILARRDGISLSDAVARLGDADDPAAAAMRLSGGDMDMASYSGFGSGAGQADAYPMGYTRARQATQGSTDVFTFGDRTGDASRYTTSGQAIIDRNELSQMDLRTWDSKLQQLQRRQRLDTPLANAPDIDPNWGTEKTLLGLDMAADPTRIGNAEMSGLFAQQQQAIDHYNDVKSISKAVDRANYVAGRIGQPLPNQALVDAARAIRSNPRATQAVLRSVGMSESEFVSNLQQMMGSYHPVFPS